MVLAKGPVRFGLILLTLTACCECFLHSFQQVSPAGGLSRPCNRTPRLGSGSLALPPPLDPRRGRSQRRVPRTLQASLICREGGAFARRDAIAAAAAAACILPPLIPEMVRAQEPAPAQGAVGGTRGRLLKDRTTTLSNGMVVSRISTGLLQMSPKTTTLAVGSPSTKEVYWAADPSSAVDDMERLVERGYGTFDVAQVYGDAEDLVGMYMDRHGGRKPSGVSFNTKWIPTGSSEKTKEEVRKAIDESRARMHLKSLDLLQLYWWDYEKPYFGGMCKLAQALGEEEGLLSGVSLTGVDAQRLREVSDAGVKIATLQCSLSIIDTRALDGEAARLCSERGVGLIAHGTLLGGFLSDKWLGAPEPEDPSKLASSQLRKYYKWVVAWGGWGLLQEMLAVMRRVGDRHGGVSVAAVAMRWVLEQQSVASVVIGTRLGGPNGLRLSERDSVFSFALNESDMDEIRAVQAKGVPLYQAFGDVGGEFPHGAPKRKGRGGRGGGGGSAPRGG